MKLVKVFSDGQFKNVIFNGEYNIILATIHDKENKKNTHNLGKTSLLIVIDFLLLSKFSNKSPILSNKTFENQTFYLEILLNSGEYLVIKRGIAEPSKISFRLSNEPLADFKEPTRWDEIRMPFDAARKYLNSHLQYDVLPNWSYRKSISYFIRTQKDYDDVFQLNKFKGKHITWKPFVFDLLGFDGSLIKQKLECDEKIEAKKKEINILQHQASVNIAEKDKILGLIDIKTEEKKKVEEEIDRFNFYTKDSAITKELIDSIDSQLQSLNAERYKLGYEIRKIKSSLEHVSTVVRLDKLKELYTEVGIFFPEVLSKKYDELEKFTQAISSEREKYLRENLIILKKEYEDIDDKIKSKEKERSNRIVMLTEADAYDKFKAYQKDLANIEGEINLLREKLRLIDNSSIIEEEIENLQEQKKLYISEIRDAINKRAHAEINRIFNQIITEIVGTNAIISIKQNTDGNVEFEADYQTSTQITTSEADGTSYKKLLCVAFDLALLIHYSKQSFYRFVYHDGVLEGLDDRIKQRLLNVTQRLCKEHNLQYILTLIDSDIPRDVKGDGYKFPIGTICLNLDDKNDQSKLFERSF